MVSLGDQNSHTMPPSQPNAQSPLDISMKLLHDLNSLLSQRSQHTAAWAPLFFEYPAMKWRFLASLRRILCFSLLAWAHWARTRPCPSGLGSLGQEPAAASGSRHSWPSVDRAGFLSEDYENICQFLIKQFSRGFYQGFLRYSSWLQSISLEVHLFASYAGPYLRLHSHTCSSELGFSTTWFWESDKKASKPGSACFVVAYWSSALKPY